MNMTLVWGAVIVAFAVGNVTGVFVERARVAVRKTIVAARVAWPVVKFAGGAVGVLLLIGLVTMKAGGW